jgi:hypothetical protein
LVYRGENESVEFKQQICTLSAKVLDNGWYVNIHYQTHLPKGYEEGAKLTAMLNSFIEVILDDPDAIMKLENLAANGYRMAFLPPEKNPDFESGESAATLAHLVG